MRLAIGHVSVCIPDTLTDLPPADRPWMAHLGKFGNFPIDVEVIPRALISNLRKVTRSQYDIDQRRMINDVLIYVLNRSLVVLRCQGSRPAVGGRLGSLQGIVCCKCTRSASQTRTGIVFPCCNQSKRRLESSVATYMSHTRVMAGKAACLTCWQSYPGLLLISRSSKYLKSTRHRCAVGTLLLLQPIPWILN